MAILLLPRSLLWIHFVYIYFYFRRLAGKNQPHSAGFGSCPCLKHQDFAIFGFEIRMAAVGAGNLDFRRILEILRKNQVTEYALVEQDECYGESPFDCLKQSYEYLARMK